MRFRCDFCVDGVAATDEFAELGVGGRDPLDDEVAGGQVAAKIGDVVHRDLAVEQKMMDDG